MPDDAVWCGACGSTLAVATPPDAPERRTALLVGVGVLLVAVVGAATAVAVRRPNGPPEPAAATEAAGRCDLDDEEPRCALWAVPAPGTRGIVVHGRVVVGRGGDAVALDATDGTTRWTTPVEVPVEGFGAAVALEAAGLAVVNGELGGARALDPFTGEVVWSVDSGSILPSDDDAPLVLRTQTGFVSGIDPASGAIVWEAALEQRVFPEVVVGSEVVVARRDQGFEVLDRLTGARVWSSDDEVTAIHGIGGGVLFVSSVLPARPDQATVVAFDVRSGERLWTRASAKGQRVVVAEDAVYLQADHTPVERLTPTTAALEWATGGVRFADVAVPLDVLARGVPVMADRWFQLLSPVTGDVVQEARVGRAGITQLTAGDDGDVVVTTPDGLHVLPADGPTRVELDAIASHVVSAAPLVVQVGDRLVRVDGGPSTTPASCVVGLRRSRCARWSVPEDGTHVEVADGVVVGVLAGAVQATSLEDGTRLWRRRIEGDPGARPVASRSGVVVVAGERLHGLDVADGRSRWSADGSWLPLGGGPGGAVAVRVGATHRLLDIVSGEVVEELPAWPEEAADTVAVGLTPETVVGRRVTEDGQEELVVVDRTDGSLVLRRPIAGGEVAVGHDSVWVPAAPDVGVTRLDARTGQTLWTIDRGRAWVPLAVGVQQPYLLVATPMEGGDLLTLRDAITGVRLWGRSSSSVTAVERDGNDLVVATVDGIDVVSVDDGATRFRLLRAEGALAGVDPVLHVRDGWLVAVDDPTR